MIMRLLALLIIPLLCMASLACDTSPDTADWKTYRNNALGFLVDYPKTWEIKEDYQDDIKSLMFYEPSGLGVFLIYYMPFASSVEEEFAKDVKAKQKTFVDFELKGINYNIDSWDLYYQYEFKYRDSGVEVLGDCYHKSMPNCYYMIDCFGSKKAFYSLPFEKVISSFSLINKLSTPQTPNESQPTSFKTYKNNSMGYAIDYPSDWSVDEKEGEKGILQIWPPEPLIGHVAIYTNEDWNVPMQVMTPPP